MFAIFQGELEARKSLKAFFLQPKLDILRNVFSFLKFCIKGPIVYYIQGGVGEGGGKRGFTIFEEAWFWELNFENAQNVRGVEILRHRTCQSI